MWDFDECRRRRRGCKSGILVDRVAMKTSCSECGLDYGIGDCGLSTVTTDPNSSDLGNLQSRGSNSLAAEPNNESSDDLLADDQADLQNLGPDPVSLASMSDSLDLPPNVKNQANEIFQKVENKSREKDRNAFFAACIYVACRQEDGMTRSIRDICSVSNGATVPDVSKAVGVIADTLNIDKNWLMLITATDLIKRFCFNLGMVGQAFEAAQEVAKNSESVERSSSPVSVAAAVVYVIAQFYDDKLLPEDVANATRVSTKTIVDTYNDLYPELSTIIPKWVAREEDLKILAKP